MGDVKVSMVGDRVELRAPWSPAMPGMCKSVYGARWNADAKVWSYPLDMDTLHRMRAVFGDRLDPEPALLSWARQEVAQARAIQHVATQADANLLNVRTYSAVLDDAMAARTYQRVGAKFGAMVGSFLLADEPGLGKTATALAALMEAQAWKGDILVIAPKTSLVTVWQRQINLWGGAGRVAHAPRVFVAPEGRAKREAQWDAFLDQKRQDEESGAFRKAFVGPRFFVVNPAMVRRKYDTQCIQCKALVKNVEGDPEHYMNHHTSKRVVVKDDYPGVIDHHWDAVILDESHDLLATVKSVWGDAKNKLSQQVQGLFDISADRRIALTGTPLRGQEKKIWGTLTWLAPERFKGYWKFMESYFVVTEDQYSRTIGALRAERAGDFHKLLDQYMLRRTRSEVRSELPDGQIMDVLVQMSDEQRKQYESFAATGEARIRDGLVSGNGVLSELTRLKQLAYGPAQRLDDGQLIPTGEGPKVEWVLQFLDERGVRAKDAWMPEVGSGYKYVVASQFTQVLDSLERRLNAAGIATLKITGSVTGAKRDRAVEIFQDDTRDRAPRVMLINTAAGGVSIELDAWADEMVILDETWVADDQVQLRGRIDNRSGRVAPRTFWYVRTADTIEQTIAERNFAQADMEHALLDGRRGVETALHMLRKDAS